MTRLIFLLLLIELTAAGAVAAPAEVKPVVARWLEAQTNLQTWSADFIQTRSLKSLTQPLTATGHVWFAAPNRFRWELGQPPKTIAVRAPQELLIFYPRLKRVERFPLAGEQTGQWREALALLEAGFPRNQAELEARYILLSQTVTGASAEVVLQPKSVAARRMMPQIQIGFDPRDFSLRGTELHFADGSTLRNEFQNAILNPNLDDQLFTPKIPVDFKTVEPLKARP